MSSARMSTKCLQMSVRVLETRPEHRTALTPAQARGHRNSGPSVPRIIDSGTRPGPQSWTEGVSLSPSGRQLQRDTTSPWSKVGECGADAQADAARAAGVAGSTRWWGQAPPRKMPTSGGTTSRSICFSDLPLISEPIGARTIQLSSPATQRMRKTNSRSVVPGSLPRSACITSARICSKVAASRVHPSGGSMAARATIRITARSGPPLESARIIGRANAAATSSTVGLGPSARNSLYCASR